MVTWTAPDETIIMDNARYDLDNGPAVVRLNFTHTIFSDNGVWRCEAVVMSRRYVASDGRLVELDPGPIEEVLNIDIQLTVIGEFLLTIHMSTDRCVAMMHESLRNPLFNVMCACM